MGSSTFDNLGVVPLPSAPSSSATLAQVQADVDLVNQAYSDGMSSMTSIIPGMGNDAAASALQGLSANIQQWIQDGTNAAKNSILPPGTNGWVGWQNAGQAYISGINQITNIGSTATLQNITQTFSDISDSLTSLPKKVAAAAGAAAGTAIASSANAAVATSDISTITVIAGVGVGALLLKYVVFK